MRTQPHGWFEAATCQALRQSLMNHFKEYVPMVYMTSATADPAKEERRARKLLFLPLEIFLCDGQPDIVFKKLQEKANPPQICGRGFKVGEPTYSCRDCGMDPTCVLCIDCFKNSEHRKHRYRMSTSQGGGYCDCGDTEAWKVEPFCDIHKKGLQQNQERDPVAELGEDLKKRAEEMFSSVLHYVIDLMTLQSCEVLPGDLKLEKTTDNYVTMLFNDEVHTYDQVINALQRSISCSQKEAVDLATTVDREGRTVVKHGSFSDCEKIRTSIERLTARHSSKPLKVHVMHTSIVAHQTFAQKLLPWLQQITSYADGLRQLFCQVAMCTHGDDDQSLIEKLLLADTGLWKSARIQSHKLFMSGVLMDPTTKKQFAIMFTKNYSKLMQDFITDDHYRAVSATSASVQIFTVPTLARLLITNHNLLQIILETFLSECKAKINPKGKLAFDRAERGQTFRRAQYMLYDLKYCLTFRPATDEWNQPLRGNFLNGFNTLLKLLQAMEGMDAVTRQTGQHVEFEPEWEGAFNLQLKLSDSLALIQSWCGSDRPILLDAFTSALEVLKKCHKEELVYNVIKVAGQEANCIKYNVGSQPVSIHVPVTRMIAGVFLQMSKAGLNLQEFHSKCGLSGEQLMEPALRVQVLIAQTQAGMWRRNGYSLLNQIYFYHNVRCRGEMYDKDIVMLQVGAALIESNQYLIHLINKFGLTSWIKEEYDIPKEGKTEDLVRQTVAVAEEYLNLLLIILGERTVAGIGQVTPQDTVKKEIIHQLCIQPMAHSELSKALPEDPQDETGIEDVVNDVATFRKPSGTGKGKYELKPEYFSHYNPYFYHYTKADQSKSEEAQRKRKKQANEDQVLPPPLPPPFEPGFAPITNLLHCDVMIHTMKLILQRMAAPRSRSRSEPQFEKILHLIGLALHEEDRAYSSGGTFHFTEKACAGDGSIYSLLDSLIGHANVTHDSQKDMLKWVIQKFQTVKVLRCGKESMNLPSVSSLSASQKADDERKRKALAAKRQERIMAQMKKMQKIFIQSNAELFESTSVDPERRESDMDLSEEATNLCPVVLGKDRSPVTQTGMIRKVCILCQEEQDVTHTDHAMVLSAFVQQSTVLSRSRGQVITNPEKYDPLFMPQTLMCGAHTSTCGHVMHADCWERYYDAILEKERSRPLRFRHHLSYDIDKMEFLCPLCETLSNSVIPIIPHLGTLTKDSEKKAVELSLHDWLDGIRKTVKASIKQATDKESEEESFLFVPCPLSSITKMMADSVAKNFQTLFDYVYDDASAHFSDSITQMLKKFSRDAYSIGLGVHPDDENVRVPVMSWLTCAFTITVVEHSLRDEGKALFGALPARQDDCLSATVKFAAVSSQVIQSDIIKQHCVNLLSALVLKPEDRKLQDTPCILDIDMFHYLVELCLSLPTLYTEDESGKVTITRVPTGDLNDQHVLHFVLAAHLAQICLSADFSEPGMETDSDEDCQHLFQLYKNIRKCAGITELCMPTPSQLGEHVKAACLPFLRSAALFFHYLTGVGPPHALTQVGGEEFEALCQYLSVPVQLSHLLTDTGPLVEELAKCWCSESAVKQRVTMSTSEPLVRMPVRVNQLIPLPDDYSQLINDVSTFTCPNSDGDESRTPTMCLVCGAILCSQSYCCQTEVNGSIVGAVTAHTITCGAGQGIFLRVRDSQVLFLSGTTKGCFYSPPYLDDYGEPDQGLRRGNPLHLCHEQYRKLQRLWLNHSIPEEIVHALESNTNLLSVEWQHL